MSLAFAEVLADARAKAPSRFSGAAWPLASVAALT
jgi:hypothetical protein